MATATTNLRLFHNDVNGQWQGVTIGNKTDLVHEHKMTLSTYKRCIAQLTKNLPNGFPSEVYQFAMDVKLGNNRKIYVMVEADRDDSDVTITAETIKGGESEETTVSSGLNTAVQGTRRTFFNDYPAKVAGFVATIAIAYFASTALSPYFAKNE